MPSPTGGGAVRSGQFPSLLATHRALPPRAVVPFSSGNRPEKARSAPVDVDAAAPVDLDAIDPLVFVTRAGVERGAAEAAPRPYLLLIPTFPPGRTITPAQRRRAAGRPTGNSEGPYRGAPRKSRRSCGTERSKAPAGAHTPAVTAAAIPAANSSRRPVSAPSKVRLFSGSRHM